MKNFTDSVAIGHRESPAIDISAQPFPGEKLPQELAQQKSNTIFSTRSAQFKNAKPSSLIEHIRTQHSNYLGVSSPITAVGHSLHQRHSISQHDGFFSLFQELLNNSVDEFLQGYGEVIDILCSSETLTIRDYGRGISHANLRHEIQELSEKKKINTAEIQFCEGLSGLGLKLANALSSRFLIRSYREQKFAEIESSQGVILRDRHGRCDKEGGTFIRFSPDPEIFGEQAIRTTVLFDILCKTAALYPGLKIRLNQNHLITQEGVVDLFQSLPQWRKLDYHYEAYSLKGKNWQLGFAHIADWQSYGGGLHNGHLVQSFVNGHVCCGGISGGIHMLQLQGAFVRALCRVFPEKHQAIRTFWDRGLTLFFALNLVEPGFQDATKNCLTGAGDEVRKITEECREQLVLLLQQDHELCSKFAALLENHGVADEQEAYHDWQSRISNELLLTEAQVYRIGELAQGSEGKYAELEQSLRTARDESDEIQKHWRDVSSQLTIDLEQAENDLNELKKDQRAELRYYRKEQEKRWADLTREQQEYLQLKGELQQQRENEAEQQEQVRKGLEDWGKLEQVLRETNQLRQDRDQEQEQILGYLRNAKNQTEAEVQMASQKVHAAEQKMLQRQEKYFENLEKNVRSGFDTIHDEIGQRKQKLQSDLDETKQRAQEKLQRLHEQFSDSLVAEDTHWKEQLLEARKSSEEKLQRRMAEQKVALQHLDEVWREQEGLLDRQKKKQRSYLERWQELLNEGAREGQAQKQVQKKLAHSRKELDEFFVEQQSRRNEQVELWEDWQKRVEKHDQSLERVCKEQAGTFENLGLHLQRTMEQEVQQKINAWLQHFESLSQEGEQQLQTQQKLIQAKQKTLENELALVQQEKDKLWSQWSNEFSNATGYISEQLAEAKQEWGQKQEELMGELDRHLEKLKQKQYTQQHRIEETQREQTQVLKQLQQFQCEADERMRDLNQHLSSYAAELKQEIEGSVTELGNSTNQQFVQAELDTQGQIRLYRQGLLEQERGNQKLIDQYQVSFNQQLAEQKKELHNSFDEFRAELQSEQKKHLLADLEHWGEHFWNEQGSKEKQMAQEAQRKRNQFWREQQVAVEEEARQQRLEFQELHKELQGSMDRERERLHKELGHLQQLAGGQEETLETLSQNLSRDITQRSEHLKQDIEDNYRHFYEDILSNTRELHQINSEERRILRDDLGNMRQELDGLTATIADSEQTLLNVQKALPDSLKLQESLDGLAAKEQTLRDFEQDIVQLQHTLNDNSQIGQKASEQLAEVLARRNELSDMEQQMQHVLELSGDLYQQRESLEQQQQRTSGYQKNLDKLEHLYSESHGLLELFDERKDQLVEAVSLFSGYNGTLGNLEEKIEMLETQLQPLELGLDRSQELQQELREQQEQLQQSKKDMTEMQEAMAELHEDSQGIDKMREWIAKTETRMLELSQDIQNNLRTVETIVRKNRPGERGVNSVGKVDSDVRNTVVQLHNKNWSSSEIARATQLSVGEVELILEMLPSVP